MLNESFPLPPPPSPYTGAVWLSITTYLNAKVGTQKICPQLLRDSGQGPRLWDLSTLLFFFLGDLQKSRRDERRPC